MENILQLHSRIEAEAAVGYLMLHCPASFDSNYLTSFTIHPILDREFQTLHLGARI